MKEYQTAHDNLFKVLAKKEVYWRQRAKQFWLHAGDTNTKFFHAWANKRRRQNSINCLQFEDGHLLSWDSGLGDHILSYFQKLFSASSVNWDEVIGSINNNVSYEVNQSLFATVLVEEVKQAIFQMNPDKSPGSDGLNPAFYQKFWQFVGSDMVDVVQLFFKSG